jgi:hypothetical protein
VACNLTEDCRGRLALRAQGEQLGSSRYRVRSGAARRATVRLSRTGRRLARGKRRLRVTVRATVRQGPNARRRVTLSR